MDNAYHSNNQTIIDLIKQAQQTRAPIDSQMLLSCGEPTKNRTVVIHEGGQRSLSVVCLSDTHNFRAKVKPSDVPQGDILVHTGDFTNRGTEAEALEFIKIFNAFPHTHKLLIAGNHDAWFDTKTREEVQALLNPNCHYLLDSMVEIEGIRFYGTPWTNSGPAFGENEDVLKAIYDKIPENIDILLTHNPPLHIVDLAWVRQPVAATNKYACPTCGGSHSSNYTHWGSPSLKNRVLQIKPKVHQFGHVHDGAPSVEQIPGIPTLFVNAAIDLARLARQIPVYNCIVE